jgi:structural maintenance of chromosome 1
MQKPDLVATDAQLKHASRKLQNAQNMGEQVTKDYQRQKEKLDGLRKDLTSVQKDANAAQGTTISFHFALPSPSCQSADQ